MTNQTFDGPVVLELSDRRALITIDRAEQRNALSPAVLEGLLAALGAAEAAGAMVAVITGAGDRAFSAGGDLSGAGMQDGAVAAHQGRARLGRLIARMQESGVVTVARVNGHALGGGLGLVLACDLAVASDTAQLGMPEIDVGLWPFIVSALVRKHAGPKVALELMMTGRRVPAPEAEILGFVGRVVPAAKLDEEVDALVDAISSKSPSTLSLGKRSFYASQDMSPAEAFEYLAGMLTLCLQTEDAAEGISAFLQKRAPDWKGR